MRDKHLTCISTLSFLGRKERTFFEIHDYGDLEILGKFQRRMIKRMYRPRAREESKAIIMKQGSLTKQMRTLIGSAVYTLTDSLDCETKPEFITPAVDRPLT